MAVRYRFDFEADFLGHIGPCHANKAVDLSLILSLVAETWDEPAFIVVLQIEQVDVAWQCCQVLQSKLYWSDCGAGQPRSRDWSPRLQRKHSRANPASELVPLVQLRRCIHVSMSNNFGFQSEDVRLRDKIARDISFLVQHFPQLSGA